MIDYPSTVSPVERWGKRVRHLAHWLRDALRHKGVPPAVIVFPDAPSRRTALYGMCRELGWELTNRPRSAAVLHLRFEDATEKHRSMPDWWPQGAWNEGCNDIRKSTLDALHQEVFGYGVAVDPLTFTGRMLEKGDGNALHDGREVEAPCLQPDANKVYQRIIDNRAPDGRVVDLRLVFIAGLFPAVYLKYKAEGERYTNETTEVKLGEVTALFTPAELERVSRLMAALRVDYAELDALRDAGDGQLYVVDVNPTPWGPPAGLHRADRALALARGAAALSARCSASTP